MKRAVRSVATAMLASLPVWTGRIPAAMAQSADGTLQGHQDGVPYLRVMLEAAPIILVILAIMVFWRYRSVVSLNRQLRTTVEELTSAQSATMLSEERFRAFAESSSDWIWEQDENFRFTLNTGPDRGGGLEASQIIGKTPWEVVDENPESPFWLAHRMVIESHQPFSDFEVDYQDNHGETRVLRVSGRPKFDAEGNFTGYWGTATDITERRLAIEALRDNERLLRDIIDGLPFAIHLWDQNERLITCNPTQLEWFPLHAEAMRPGCHYSEQIRVSIRHGLVDIPADDPEGYVESRLDVFRHPERYPNEQIRIGDRWLQVINTKLPHGYTISVRLDITEAKAAEERLRQAQKMEAVGQLTGGVAHDFNNLLGVIIGNAELMGEEKADPENPRLVALLRAAERGAELTQRLLAFSRRQALQPRALDLNTVVRDMTEMLQRTLGETVEIQTELAESLWLCDADPGQVETALLNLAVNARDAMPHGGKLTVESDNVELDASYAATYAEVMPGSYVMLAVSDNGTGISPENLSRVFEPFFTTKDVGKGSGLGLSMVYGFAKQSGGHVAIYSELGHGTSVKLYLPKAASQSIEERHGTSSDSQLPQGEGEVVLVVEDDPDLLALTVAHLENLGYSTLQASDSKGGIEVLGSVGRVDLLLTDVVLPGGVGGPALARTARLRHPGVRVLFMSGYTENSIVHHGKLDRGVRLLAKPFRLNEVAVAVRQALDSE